MKVRWTGPALKQFAEQLRYVRLRNVTAARRVNTRIQESVAALETMSERGRPGKVSGTRELIFPPWKYIVVYEVIGEQVFVLAFRHSAQEWPPES